MCNLYSMTKNQDAIRRLFSFDIESTGNLPTMPGIFPDYPAPIMRNKADATELTLARWGMPSSQFAQMQAAKKARRQAPRQGHADLFQGTAAVGAGQRHDEYPQSRQQTLEAMARCRIAMPGAIHVLQ